jgi:hypothetical protein
MSMDDSTTTPDNVQTLDKVTITQNKAPANLGNGVQYFRKAQLFVLTPENTNDSNPLDANDARAASGPATPPTQTALDLSAMHFTFETSNADVETPNTARIRIFNLAESTVKSIINQYTNVILQAGYENANYGMIFSGTIKQFHFGKETNVDTYLELLCADGDTFYNFSFCSESIAANRTSQEGILDAATKNSSQPLGLATDAQGLVGGVNPTFLSRGKVLFGLSRDYVREWSTTNGFRWSIQNGQLVLVPIGGLRPGQVVQLNKDTGLIGQPTATESGIQCTCLLNPLIRIGCLIQINNADINKEVPAEAGQSGLSYTNPLYYPATVTNDGYYRVLVAEFEGDTRGDPWFCHITALAADISTNTVPEFP